MRRFLWLALAASLVPGQQPVFKTSANLVIVTVFVRDRDGRPVEGLKKNDFIVTENGVPQTISVFEFQRIDTPEGAPGAVAGERVEPAPAAPAAAAPVAIAPERRDKRLLVLFFDWSSMSPAEEIRAVDAAKKWITSQMAPNDLVSILGFSTKLKVEQDFTSSREALLETLELHEPGTFSDLVSELGLEEESGEDSAFSADQAEFNLFNTDRRLNALEDAARRFSAMPEKKAIIWFSGGGGGQVGIENQSQLRSTINAAVRANVSFYPVDVRGLVAAPPGGDASQRGGGGSGIYTGQTQRQQGTRFAQQQETLSALASDTGGKALMDTNDLSLGIVQAQRDLRSYYVLGYYSSDERRDGRFRRVEVKLAASVQRATLEYRRGYFAEKEFSAFTSYDKEKQLQDALLLGDPITDLQLALEVNRFRMAKNRYFIPVAVKIPGSAVPLAKKGDAETTTFDFIGEVRDAKGRLAASVRDNIRIRLRESNVGQLARRSLVYDTGFTLEPGEYRLKMLVRENLTGRMGTFETRFEVPQPKAGEMEVSSVVLSSQREPVAAAVGRATRKDVKRHPLLLEKEKLVPSVTRVFRTDQKLYALAEVYDPAPADENGGAAIGATLGLYRNGTKVFETQPVRVNRRMEGRGDTAAVLIETLLTQVPPGRYVAQMNLIDFAGRKFSFQRAPIVVVPAPAGAPSPAAN